MRSESARSPAGFAGANTNVPAPSHSSARPAASAGRNAVSGASPARTSDASTPPRKSAASSASPARRSHGATCGRRGSPRPNRSRAHSAAGASSAAAAPASCAAASFAPAPASSAKTSASRSAPTASAVRRRRARAESSSKPRRAASRRRYWRAVPRPSFDCPYARSTNTIGTSVTSSRLPPFASSSSRILKPCGASPSASSSPRRVAKNPESGSRAALIGHASADANREASRRRSGQPGVDPPGTRRLPIATPASWSRTGCTSAGITRTGCERSASITTTTSARAARAPAITALARPRAPWRCTSRTGRVSAHASTRSTVPSDDASSTTTTSNGPPASSSAKIWRRSSSTFSTSFKVGTTMEKTGACASRPAARSGLSAAVVIGAALPRRRPRWIAVRPLAARLRAHHEGPLRSHSWLPRRCELPQALHRHRRHGGLQIVAGDEAGHRHMNALVAVRQEP